MLKDIAYSKTILFRKRVEKAEKIIREALDKTRKPYVACSWGKDSTAMLHLVLQQKPDVHVVFINQGYNCPLTKRFGVSCGEWPDTYAIRDRLVKDWKLNYVELHPPCVCSLQRRHGLPYVGFGDWAVDRKIYADLIWGPVREAILENGFDGCFMGLRGGESRGRRIATHVKGQVRSVKGFGIVHAYPLADWSIDDVWAYTAKNALPYNSVYDKQLPPEWTRDTIRNAPWMTTYRIVKQAHWSYGYLVWLRKFYPGHWNVFRRVFPEISSFT